MNQSFEYLPKEERKKILLICDDIRVHSGVATVAREIVVHTCHHFNWVNIAGAIKHPEKGKALDISKSTGDQVDVKDPYVMMYPTDGYGNVELLRQIITRENPDAIMLITDPRYFTWLFNAEQEIRKNIPIAYLNIWDDYPAPMYNSAFYEACDLLMGISKQTVNINQIVLGDKAKNRIFKYVPHGLDLKDYHPVPDTDEGLIKFKNDFFNKEKPEFVLFFNSRNIRRKQIPDAMLAFRSFLDTLPIEKANKCKFVLHTEIRSDHGTDLRKVKEYFFDESYPNVIKFSTNKLDKKQLNYLYNIADAQILLTSNEGWGLTITEAMLAGTPFIANVTGGMQDQMRFEYDMDEGPGVKKGEWINFDKDFPSNHRGTYKKHGEWALPIYPTNLSLVGSPKTPYIYDDKASFEDASNRIMELYKMGDKKRKEIGKSGMEWALSDEAGFTSEKMSNRIIEGIDELFDTWKPRAKFEFLKDTDYEPRVLKHEIIY